ncbi:LytTR family DNA-binding domain-containing protein [Aliiglaciecola sp. CAU 1673]|uniref:LytR/AlgR family response regulator transcription factor n=1 Tax=Aliiglaciecola sp. CAU 1673 TaxID=3032595 RepID=UPI0023DA034A|nr:LytTR family DNA-binding domain-containing protein [Aliiglaciecola sp. CAU 1673]MDF2179856.1 LytTR family DNA-binding domain-containing protein [Aliiglaciecola sp. CAU 1673]
MPLKVLLVDDEPLARDALRLRLLRAEGFVIAAEADNGEDALLLAKKLQPDVVFLDINMPRLSGIEAAKVLSQYCSAQIVFVSAYEQYAIEAFRLAAVDYLTKPINDEFFAQTLSRLQQRHEQGQPAEKTQSTSPLPSSYLQRLALKDEGETVMVETRHIDAVESVGDYLCIKACNRVFVVRYTMKQLCSLLDPEFFVRCHRSHLLNLEKIDSLQQTAEGTFLVCQGNSHPVSRRYLAKVKERLKTFAGKV